MSAERATATDSVAVSLRSPAARLRPQPTALAALTALAGYADAFHRETGTPLGTDCVLGASWITALRSVLELRNGPLYGLDAGMLGTLASKIALRAGFDRSVLREGF